MKKVIILVLTLIILTSTSLVYADDTDFNDDPIDEVFEVIKKDFIGIGDLESNIMKYESSNYYLDIKKYSAIFDPIKRLTSNVNSLNNLLFGLNKIISKLTIFILLISYKFDLFKFLGVYIDQIIDALRVPVFDKTILTIIAFVGLYSVIAAVFADRKTTVIESTVRTIIVVTIAFIFLLNPSKYLTQMNNLSVEVSDEIFKSTYARYRKIPDSEDALVSAGSMLWDVMVHKPWQALELGSNNERLTDEILSRNPYDDIRTDIINDLAEDNSLLRLEGIPIRFGSLLLFIVANCVLAFVIVVISGTAIGAQVLVVIFSFMAPFVFLISLIPRFSNTLGSWGLKLIGYSFIKIALSVFLSILLVINAAIYSNISSNGLFITLVLMLIATFTIYYSRNKIIGVIKAIPKGERNIRREIKAPGASEKVKDVKSIVTGYAKEKTISTSKAIGGKVTGTVNTGKEKIKGIYNRQQQERYRQMATEYLENKYMEEKEKAELKAQRLGRDEAVYTDFVKEADMREKIGEGKFTESQINHVIKVIRKIEMEGEDPNKFIEGEIDELNNKAKSINKNLKVFDSRKLSNKELLNEMGKLENEIRKKRDKIESSKDISIDNREKELYETYKLWQQKFELMNIYRDREIEKHKNSYSKFNEYKELQEVRSKVNEQSKEMAKIFNDENYTGDKIKDFDEKLDIQLELREMEEKLIQRLEKKNELADIRDRAYEQERNIINKFGLDKIKNNDMLVHEREKYLEELKKLDQLYTQEENKVEELQNSGIDVISVNEELRRNLKGVKGNEVEKLLIARAELGIMDEGINKISNDVSNDKQIDNGISEQSKVNTNKESKDVSLTTNRRTENDKSRPVKIEQRLDVNKLMERDEEILHELDKRVSSQETNKGRKQNMELDSEYFERLGEEISKNIEKTRDYKGGNINLVQNIKQDVVIQRALELDKEFAEKYNLKNNQVFFENLIRKYGTEAVETEIQDMKNQNDIRNPKGLLIARLKNNYKNE